MRKPYIFRTRVGITPFMAAARLMRFGVVPMNPCVYTYARKSKDGPAILEARPQLPGYFAGMFDPATIWQVTQSQVLGRPLSFDGTMRPIDLDTWTQILDLNSYSAEAPQLEMARGLKAGMTVILRNGPHAGQRLRLQSTSNNGKRAKAVMHILGSLREVTITAENVEIVEAA